MVAEIYGSRFCCSPRGFVPNVSATDSFLFFLSLVFSKTCFYDFTKKTRHNGSLQLYILQPAWTLHSSRGARCKYFPLLRCYRKEPSNYQLRPRTIRMLLQSFFQNPIFHETSFSLGVTRSPSSPCRCYRGSHQAPCSPCCLGFNPIILSGQSQSGSESGSRRHGTGRTRTLKRRLSKSE